MTDSTTDDLGEWLRLAREAFGVYDEPQPGATASPGLSGFTAN